MAHPLRFRPRRTTPVLAAGLSHHKRFRTLFQPIARPNVYFWNLDADFGYLYLRYLNSHWGLKPYRRYQNFGKLDPYLWDLHL